MNSNGGGWVNHEVLDHETRSLPIGNQSTKSEYNSWSLADVLNLSQVL